MPEGLPRSTKQPYPETFWVMALSVLMPIALALILFISIRALATKGAFLAGDVAGSHAPFELECQQCHAAWRGPTDAKCQACHTAQLIRDHAPGWELPADTVALKMTDCKHCHIDHQGRTADLKAQASSDCILCHGFKSTGEGHPEVRMVTEKLYGMPQNGFRQFKHSDHVGLSIDRSNPGAHKLDCKDCHTFEPGDRVLKSTQVDFKKDCASCHSDELTWKPSRRAAAVTVEHPAIPELQAVAGMSPHDAFLAWSSSDHCGKCHMLIEKTDPNNPATVVGMDVAPTRIQSEGTWIKVQHWGYSEFSHARHTDPGLSGAAHPLHCTDCHQSSDGYATIESPSFEKHCTQCHSGDTSVYLGRRVPPATVVHPAVPTFPDPKDQTEAAAQLSLARQWAGRDPSTGLPLSLTTEETRKCAKCHTVNELPGATAALRSLPSVAYVDLEPLLAQSGGVPPAASSESPSSAPASAAASPSATDTGASASPSAGSASPSATGSPAVLTTPLALPPLAEDALVPMGKYYQVRVIAPISGPVSEVTHFNHRAHITILGENHCDHCHKVSPSNGTVQAGPGFFDMELLPSIAVCAECHRTATNGVSNRCGTCHDFHDKTERTLPAQLSPSSYRPAPVLMAAHFLSRDHRR